MYAASVPAPLVRFVGSKHKYERFGNLASKGVTIGGAIGGKGGRMRIVRKIYEIFLHLYIYKCMLIY